MRTTRVTPAYGQFSTRIAAAPPAARERRTSPGLTGQAPAPVSAPRPTGPTPEPTPVDVFVDPIVQLAAICPLCALAALRPEAALAAISPALAVFNPALNPGAALLSFSLGLTEALSQRTASLAEKVSRTAVRATLSRMKLQGQISQPLTT